MLLQFIVSGICIEYMNGELYYQTIVSMYNQLHILCITVMIHIHVKLTRCCRSELVGKIGDDFNMALHRPPFWVFKLGLTLTSAITSAHLPVLCMRLKQWYQCIEIFDEIIRVCLVWNVSSNFSNRDSRTGQEHYKVGWFCTVQHVQTIRPIDSMYV